MKNLIVLFFAVTSAISFAQTNVTVSIMPKNDYPIELWSYDLKKDAYTFTYKLRSTKKGSFQFEVSGKPNLYKLKLFTKELVFINDNDSHITINIDLANPQDPFRIQGSKATAHYVDYFQTVSRLQKRLFYPLEPKMKIALEEEDEAQINKIQIEYAKNQKLFVFELDTKITNMRSSLAVYAIAKTLDFNKYLPNISKWHTTFLKERPNFNFTLKLTELIKDADRLQIGSPAPEIELALFNSKNVAKLSNLKGEMILVDFWASWCLPCIKENKILKEKYESLRSKGLTIWSISTDEKKDKWVKALTKYNLPWMQSLSNKEVETTYGVVSLPTNFLIDKKGNIIAKNIKAEEIETYLNKK